MRVLSGTIDVLFDEAESKFAALTRYFSFKIFSLFYNFTDSVGKIIGWTVIKSFCEIVAEKFFFFFSKNYAYKMFYFSLLEISIILENNALLYQKCNVS